MDRKSTFLKNAERLLGKLEHLEGPHSRLGKIAVHAGQQLFENDNPEFVNAVARLKRIPVPIDEFIESNDFLAGVEFDIWPKLKDDIRALNPDVLQGEKPVHEALLGGATGTGKSHVSLGSMAYQTYMLTCFDRPQRLYGLTPATPIVFMMQSVSATVTKRVLYNPFRDTVTGMRYFQKFAPHDDRVTSELFFPQYNIKVIPALANLTTILGQAVAGAILDEVNFMTVIENSKRVPGPDGMGGKFDQAEVIYTNISRRRKRSFTTRGVSIGCIHTVSSTRYKNDFLDRRIDQAREIEEDNVVTFRHKQYEVNPRYNDPKISTEEGKGHHFGTFRIAVGNEEMGTVVLSDDMVAGVHYPSSATILEVPLPYKADFMKDPDAALRDVVGIATDAITPFIRRRQKINDAVSRGRGRNIKPLVEKDEVILIEDGMPTFISENFSTEYHHRRKSRWIHVDLSRVEDRCGIGMVCLEGFQTGPNRGEASILETLPRFTVELAVGIKPSPNMEIDISAVRAWIMQIIRDYGYNVEGVSFDGFDSQESIQMFRKSGVYAEMVSVDKSMVGYDAVRDMLYEDRLDIQPDCELLTSELRTIEYYNKQNKVDHPPNGTKDVSDGVAGAIQAALDTRIVRNGMQMVDADPSEEQQATGQFNNRFRVRRERVRVEREIPKRDDPL